ncbi:MAG: radical SAM family heme chaperone HemW [Flammeovirgaceae bacterium]|nr:MAG: radical SAM family heme chaperone HemW [Flammeovirgaceae bacterium]
MAGIYIHIPFCRQACHYCDFHFSTNRQIEPDMIAAFEKEMELRSDYIGNEVIDTIYLGGGTPSILSPQSLERIFNKINHLFTVTSVAEITLEANPDDLTKEKLLLFKNVGINRLSLGVQTFDDSLLRYLNRAHNGTQAQAGFEQARAAGFSNISVDLMYAIPGQTINGFNADLEKLLVLQPEHISAYCLTIEERTAFGHWLKTNSLQPVADEQAADYLQLLMEVVEATGYEQYEISNFAKPGYYSQHNSNYWKQVSYLGIGPGAHSYNGTSRQANIANNYRYVKSILAGEIPAQTEYLTREEKINEYILTTLRTRWGLDTAKLKADFDFDLIQKNKALLTRLLDDHLAELTNGVIQLTRSGKLLADKIAADFFEVSS